MCQRTVEHHLLLWFEAPLEALQAFGHLEAGAQSNFLLPVAKKRILSRSLPDFDERICCPVVFFCRLWRVSGRHLITSPALRLVCKFFCAILRFVRGVGRMYQNAVSHMMRMGRVTYL